jgi:hypothetical protein
MNAGVWTGPCGVEKVPLRAEPHVWWIVNSKAMRQMISIASPYEKKR